MPAQKGSKLDKYLIVKIDGQARHYRVQSVGEYLELCAWLYGNEQVVFRGQRRQHPLLPSVARNVEYVRTELSVFDEFKREALPYLDYIPSSPWQWLAVAQHNGLPTRLLDWTKHSLAALWFAVERPPEEDESGVVWAYAYRSEETTSNEECKKSPFEISETRIYFPDHIFPYIQAQSGLFTIHHRENDSFVPMEKLPHVDLRLTKIEIPADAFPTIRYHLFRGGIHHASLFPGLNGLVQRIRYKHELLIDEKMA